MQRILHITADLQLAGAERQLSRLACRLPRGEFESVVCALGRDGPIGDELRRAGVAVTAIGRRAGWDPSGLRQLARLVASVRPDVIHAWRSSVHGWALAARRLSGRARLVLTQHRMDFKEGAIGRLMRRAVLSRTDRVVVNSPSTSEQLARRGWPAERIIVIPNGVPAGVPATTTRSQWLAELGLPDTSRLVGVIGKLELRKRLKDAIWTTDLLQVIRDDVHLLIIGVGPHAGRLRRFRRQTRTTGKVHFLGWRCDVPSLLPHFDVFWSTSQCEGQSCAILEAMAAGVPVVATDIAGTRDLIVPGETGFLFPVGDRAALTRMTNQLLDDRGLARQIGAAGQKGVTQRFRLAAMIDAYARLYRELAA